MSGQRWRALSGDSDRPGLPRAGAAVPRAAIALGGLGLIPFAGLTVAHLLAEPPARAAVTIALAAYGAVILSFLGGIQWGLALRRATAPDPRLLFASVVPPIAAWTVVAVAPSRFGLSALAVGFVLVLLTDIWLGRHGYAPPWFLRLRRPLTVAVAASLAIAAFAPV